MWLVRMLCEDGVMHLPMNEFNTFLPFFHFSFSLPFPAGSPLPILLSPSFPPLPCVGAHVCIVAFSTVDRDSFLAVENWKKKVCPLSVMTTAPHIQYSNLAPGYFTLSVE